jgi:hypothetical protein
MSNIEGLLREDREWVPLLRIADEIVASLWYDDDGI